MVSNLSFDCKYRYSKLKNVIYLVNSIHLKDIHIDGDEVYIDGLNQTPIRLECYNLQLNEEESLDERYKFSKTLTFSIYGYVSRQVFNDIYYAIVEDIEGIKYMVNVDFPARITYTFNLSKQSYNTEFTFSTQSNYPTMKLNGAFQNYERLCSNMNIHMIDKLQIVEFENATIDTENRRVNTSKAFSTVDFLKNSLQLQESYDGSKITDTISFTIPLNEKLGWSWKLLEFLQNNYVAIVTPIGTDDKFYVGFNYGLQPSYTIQSASQGDSDVINVTLTETSMYGLTASDDWSININSNKHYVYVERVNDVICYECIGLGLARYLVKQQVDAFGNPTGNYQVKQGYQNLFPELNIVGTFNDEVTFASPNCKEGEYCDVSSTIPTTIVYNAVRTNTYTLQTSCDWEFQNIPSYITVSPTTGRANSSYSVTIRNTATPTDNPREDTMFVKCCNSRKAVNVKVQTPDAGCIRPSTANINCLAQTVQFTYNGNCRIRITSADPKLSINVGYNTLTVTVPRNETTSAITWTITASDCECSSDSTSFRIIQDKVYEDWITDTTGYICDYGNSYTVERLYTGVTLTSTTGRTNVTRAGQLIEEGDSRCVASWTKWEFVGNYYCIDGNKVQASEEFITTDGGHTWTKTGNARTGHIVETSSSWCTTPVTYSWRLSDEWTCDKREYYKNKYLTFIPVTNSAFFFSGSTSSNSVYYSTNSGSTWTRLQSNGETNVFAAGTEVWWKATGLTVSGTSGIGGFLSSGSFNVEGNVMSLVSGDSFANAATMMSYQFAGLFQNNSNLISAENLILPASTLTMLCYGAMFQNCTALTKAPELPSTNLDSLCYSAMFYNCRSLTTAPELPATTLDGSCYAGMFEGCTSLATAPALPAMSLAANCYDEMFSGCTALTVAPVLSATTLEYECYRQMFNGCSSLNRITCLATNMSATRCTDNWLAGVQQYGNFYKASTATWPSGSSGIPSRWTVHNLN